MAADDGAFHTGTVRRTAIIHAPRERVWSRVSQITRLSWVAGVRSASGGTPRSGPGAVRKIRFEDGSLVRERIVGWKRGRYLSYVAVGGLPLRAYHATIGLAPTAGGSTRIVWQSYLDSCRMTRGRFSEFVSSLGSFYADSLANLKKSLEG